MHEKPSVEGEPQLLKVAASLGLDAWHGLAEEIMWAELVTGDLVRLRNTPFFATGLAFMDHVNVQERDGHLVIKDVVSHSGHSTYRVLFEVAASGDRVRDTLKALNGVGCVYESYVTDTYTIYAVDTPPEAVDAAYQILESGQQERLLDFDEGFFGGRG